MSLGQTDRRVVWVEAHQDNTEYVFVSQLEYFTKEKLLSLLFRGLFSVNTYSLVLNP